MFINSQSTNCFKVYCDIFCLTMLSSVKENDAGYLLHFVAEWRVML